MPDPLPDLRHDSVVRSAGGQFQIVDTNATLVERTRGH